MVIGLKRAGWSIRQIAADTHLGASTVHRLWRRWLEQGNVAIYRNVGATRVTSARVDRRILRQAVAAPQATCTAILQHVQDILDHSISNRTISRRLVANGLHSCRLLRRLPLTPPNRRQRLEWCRARSTWMTEWHRVVFSDESRFCLSSDSRRVRVWRRRGERSNPAAIVERPTVRQRGIMVWGAIAYDSRSPLLRIQGTMTAQRYVDDVLRPVTLPYLQGVPNALYQQDNARPHTARISQQALQDVQMLPWPPYSPDLSPIEHVWDIIGRRLHALPQPRSEDKLWQMVEREWRAIPQDAIRTLIDSLPRRVAACIAVRGGHRKRRQFKQTDAFTRGMVIGLKRAGWSIRQIAADTHLGASTVHRLWRRWLEQGNVAIYRNVGATRVTSARVDRRILRQAVAAPQATCTAILQHVQDILDHSISNRTISRRLVANGLHSCRLLRRLPLTPPNRRQRLEWCRARSTWMTEWHRVVFSDESRFCLSSDSRRVRVWRRRGERSNPAAIVERPTVRQRGIMVWGAIAYDSRSPLLRIQGTMTAQRYVDDVLRPVTLPYLQGVPNALYQQDNARPHTARISQQALQDVQMLPWPPYSPDLSPIEHVWDIIGRRLHALPQPRSEDKLWQMVEREWRAIPQDAIRTLIDSLPRRVAACIAVRG
ncbi:Transposase, partial [Cordylochernes scorpioides]